MGEVAIHEAAFLKELARQVRRDTLRLLTAAPSDSLTWTPLGTANHIIWHAGHALWLQDHFAIGPLAGQSELPAGWENLFASGSDPTRPPAPWPERAVLADELRQQYERMAELLDTAGRTKARSSGRDRQEWLRFAASLIHGIHDEARHQGQMSLLIRLAARSGGGRS